MSKDPDKATIAEKLAVDVSFSVLDIFTENCPEVAMSYDNWMYLRYVIDQEIRRALGVATDDAEDGEKPTVQ